MPQFSAGILLYRRNPNGLEVLLVHPGGPFWARKDEGAWSIPKGLHEPDEDAVTAARREFREETGLDARGALLELGSFRQRSGKVIHAWALEGDCEPSAIRSNLFQMEWPPRSGKRAEFPEIDRAAWFAPEEAAKRILKGQRPILEMLLARLDASSSAIPASRLPRRGRSTARRR